MSAAPERDVVVVGASAGGVEALQRLAGDLPGDLPAAVLVVLHVSPTAPSVLPRILERAGNLPVAHAETGEPLEPGRMYVAPPDHHLQVRDATLELGRGPKENGHRPSVDALFRSAAESLGRRVIGVVLTGALDDGSAGLAKVVQAGGVAVVQDPETALYPSMPAAALAATQAVALPLDEIGPYLVSMTSGDGAGRAVEPARGVEGMAATGEGEPTAVELGNDRDGELTGFTCPECNGTLWQVEEGDVVRLRCRVGHSYSTEGFARAHAESLEASLWAATRALQEKAAFSRRMAERSTRTGPTQTAQRYERQADESERLAQELTQLLERVSAPLLTEDRVGGS